MRRTEPSARKALDDLFDRWLDFLRSECPVEASKLGFEECRTELGPNSPEFHRKRARVLEDLLRKLEALPPSAFAGEDALDRREFLSRIRTDLFFTTSFPAWRLNPQFPIDAVSSAIFEFVIRTRGAIENDAAALAQRLSKIPRFLEESIACIKKPDPAWCALAGQAARGAGEFFEALEKQIAQSFPADLRGQAVGHCASARNAVKKYLRRFRNMVPGHKGTFAVGGEGLSFLIRERLGLDLSPAEIEATGWKLIGELRSELETEAGKWGGKKANQILEEAAAEWNPGDSLIETYTARTNSLRQAIVEKNLAGIPPGESLRVLPAPPFMRHHFPTAAYSAPGPFAKTQEGIFWVNDLGLSAPTPAKAAAERRQHFGIDLTCAHEAYPGHHLQFVVQNRIDSRIRRMADHAVFYEGWTLWCEHLTVQEYLADFPELRLLQLRDALWRACRIVIDCGIQTGTMTIARARKLLVEEVGFTPARAKGDLNWYTSAPSIPMSYLLGFHELQKTREHYLRFHPRSTPREFHDWALNFGAVPWSWIRETL